ncbi:G protein-coupled receptor, rhodopsin-like,GPCR, rhodopsin-like, 7TM [Cinara cedri]|uniref:G protein-coupled receptor, rhodopsin-like,GPCR, rhodopsin-like, 7TM n=1 Tax=Cinara cedri TaxID=506608 RepID=A0A5E4MRH8_9HEMI|nr:G protein-coupled receptor, rhodopsin-like,GPCR, rhodopsin-like, 7TM [Cinara cedri]
MNEDYVPQHLISDATYLGAATVLSIIGIVGFLFNACVIFIMLRDPQLWTPQNVIIFNLASSDFAVSILGNPVTLAAAITKGWIFGHTLCVVYGFFMALLGIASITTLTVLAYDRYLMIRYPFSSSRLTKGTALYAVAGIWFYAFVVTGPPLLGWNRYVNESANISCSIDWESGEHSNYVIYIFVFGLFIPVTVIIYSYVSLVLTVRKRAAEKIIGQATKAECRVAIMVAMMILAFLTAWMPYSVMALLIAFGGVRISPAVSIIPALCAKSSICWNPIIYIGLNTQFRTAWKRFLNLPGMMSEGSMDGEITTGVSKLIVGQSELVVHSTNSAVVEVDPPSGLMCCLAQDEHSRPDNPEKYGCTLEMTSNEQEKWAEAEFGDVLL